MVFFKFVLSLPILRVMAALCFDLFLSLCVAPRQKHTPTVILKSLLRM